MLFISKGSVTGEGDIVRDAAKTIMQEKTIFLVRFYGRPCTTSTTYLLSLHFSLSSDIS